MTRVLSPKVAAYLICHGLAVDLFENCPFLQRVALIGCAFMWSAAHFRRFGFVNPL